VSALVTASTTGRGRPLRLLLFDEDGDQHGLADSLRALECSVTLETSAALALTDVRQSNYDLALCVLGSQPRRSLELVSTLLATDPPLDVVVVAPEAGFRSAVEAMRRGARDYVALPLRPGQLRRLVDEYLATTRGDQRAAPAPLALGRRDPALGGPFSLLEIEKEHVKRVLAWTSSIAEAARILNVDPRTLQRRFAASMPRPDPMHRSTSTE
jgi:ActR/RegA family two-component response regulator